MSDETRTARRFWKYVRKTDGCWEWTAYTTHLGYGRFRVGTDMCLAHRVSWTLANGRPPDGLMVLHRCDNPTCVRPDHLFLGTNADNMRDLAAKGRGRPPEARGAANGNARLSDADVAVIRRLAADPRYTSGDIGELFRVTRNHVRAIVDGRAWRAA